MSAKGKDVDLTTDFEGAASGASQTIPKQCSALRKNEVCMIKGKPCKIVDMSTSKTGKHGHAKVCYNSIDSQPRLSLSAAFCATPVNAVK